MNAQRLTRSHRAYFGVFLVVGLSFGLVGPSLSLLAEQVNTNLASVGIVLVTYGFGYVLGTQIFARGYDRGFGNRLIGVSLLIAACSFALVPVISGRILLAIFFLLFGAAVSTSDVGCNTLIVWELRDRVGPKLALMHTMFGIGAILSPLIVRASDEIRGDAAIAYWLAAASIATIAIIVLLHRAPIDPHLANRESEGDISNRQILLIVVFFLAYVAVEVVFVTWIYTYGIKTGMSKNESAVLTSTYWIGFMLGRVATVFLARKSHDILFIQLGAMLNIAVCAVLFLRLDMLLVPCAIIYGVAAAPQFPLMFGFIGNRTSLSGKMTARIVGTAGLSSTTLPWLAGQFLERIGIWTLPTFLAVVAATVLVAASLISNSFGVPKHVSKAG